MNLNNDIIITGNRAIAKSYAKVNLTLDVLGRLENGYHEVEMIMQSLTLFDLIIIDKRSHEIHISTNIKSLPNNDNNIAYKAAKLFFETTNVSGGAKILIHKNIPIAAGLAGGSGNAAAVLCGLNLLYNTNLSHDELLSMALKLGADVPYCIIGGTCLAKGIGENLTPLSPIPTFPVVLVKPDLNISTKLIYDKIDSLKNPVHPNNKSAIEAISNADTKRLFDNMDNLMEDVTSDICPEIKEIESTMYKFGAEKAMMSGSGPSVFGLFSNDTSAKKAFDELSKKYSQTFLTHTFN